MLLDNQVTENGKKCSDPAYGETQNLGFVDGGQKIQKQKHIFKLDKGFLATMTMQELKCNR